MNDFLQIPSGGAKIPVTLHHRIGPKEGQFGPQVQWMVLDKGMQKIWSCSEWKDAQIQNMFDQGVKNVVIYKVFKNGKNYVNCDPDDGKAPITAAQVQKAFDPGPTPPQTTDWDSRERKIGRGQCFGIAAQYVLRVYSDANLLAMTADKFAQVVAIEAEKMVEAQRQFINKV